MRGGATHLKQLKGNIGRETDKAIQFTVCEDKHPLNGITCWFPVSHISSIHRGTIDKLAMIYVSDWILDRKIEENDS